MKDKSKLIAIILVVITVIVVVISNFVIKDSEINEEQINVVTNYSNFYTVNSCLYRTITYLSTDDKDSLFLILNDKYKENENVTLENILDLFPNVESDSIFVSEKMYYSQLSKNMTKYYVKGHIEKNEMPDDEAIISKLKYDSIYFLVYLDSSNKIFSIEPYDGKVFIEGES